MITEEEIQQKKRELQEKIDDFEKQRMELKVADGKAFHCKKCNRIVHESSFAKEQEEHQLCWVCLNEKRKAEERQKLLDKLKGAVLTDLTMHDRFGGIAKLVFETDSKKFVFQTDCWADDHSICLDAEYEKDGKQEE